LAINSWQKAVGNSLGTPNKNKRLVVYDTDHYITKSDMVREVFACLDKYTGPVTLLSEK
jgi:phosphatidate phosphatase PAH1